MYEYFVDIWNMSHETVVTNEWGQEFHPSKLYYKGLLGDLCHEKVDAAGTSQLRRFLAIPRKSHSLHLGTVMFTFAERLKYFKFLVSTAKELQVIFIFRAPPLPYSHNIFALPFDKNIWTSCAIVLSLCGLVIWIIMSWEAKVASFAARRGMCNENAASFLDIVMMQVNGLKPRASGEFSESRPITSFENFHRSPLVEANVVI